MRVGSSGKCSKRLSQVLYLPPDPTPDAVFYHTARVYGAFNDLLGCIGGLQGPLLAHSADSVYKLSRFDAS